MFCLDSRFKLRTVANVNRWIVTGVYTYSQLSARQKLSGARRVELLPYQK